MSADYHLPASLVVVRLSAANPAAHSNVNYTNGCHYWLRLQLSKAGASASSSSGIDHGSWCVVECCKPPQLHPVVTAKFKAVVRGNGGKG